MLLAIALGGQAPPAVPPLPLARTMRIDRSIDDDTQGVARLVGGLIGYANWPQPRSTITICTMGATRLATRLDGAGAVVHQPVVIRNIATGSGAASQGCDILYLGAMPVEERQRAIMAIHGQPVLSIAEGDPDCRSGAMFCLLVRDATLSFRLNLDAVSRGTVRIDPRVLRLFADEGDGS